MPGVEPFAVSNNDDSHSFGDGSDNDPSGQMESKELDMQQEQAALNNTLARKENRAIRILRIVVLLVLIAAAVVAAVVVYLFLKHSEENEFNDNFDDLATRLLDGVLANAQRRVQVLDMLAISLTASALATNQSWPYVTFDDFEARCTAARVIIESEYIGLYPYVTTEQRRTWEQYTIENTAWINESFAYQQYFKSVHNRTVGARAPARRFLESLSDWDQIDWRSLQSDGGENMNDEDLEDDVLPGEVRNATFDGPDGITTELYRYGTEEEEFLFVVEDAPGPYYPMWQVSPAREYTAVDVNYNINDPFYAPAYVEALGVVQSTSNAVFAGVWNVLDDGTFDPNDDYDFREVPAAPVFFPVFDAVQGEKNVVGIIELDFEFGPLMSSVLPPNSNRLLCVISSPCDQAYTYEVTGLRSTYLGPEDLHDPAYDSMKMSALMTDFDRDDFGAKYNGPIINKEFCPWKIEVYATEDLENEFLTQNPVYYMLVVLAVFAFVSCVFVVYDIIVEMRQKKVMMSAVSSDQIVASFFPKEFRDKLYEEKKEAAKIKKKQSKGSNDSNFPTTSAAFQTESVREFLMGDNPTMEASKMSTPNSPPIAENFPDCTVFFADIAGFTNWSSSRNPCQVFTLLETFYGAFDKLARKHKVFKIETIGDCYVAVTGLPQPQPDHALLLVKFARDCLQQQQKLSRRLEGTLGPDTAELGLRIGLHSGPCTAGVLRGDKARFQLFGDTVNTASRMESLGKPCCIHVSQETADILISMGKGHWVKKRPDKIVAKGKGELQTFFVSPASGAKSVDLSQTSSDVSSTMEDDDQVEIEMAIAKMAGTEEAKIDWSEKHCRRVAWAADLLKDELKQIVAGRGAGSTPTDVWNKEVDVSTKEARWDDELSKALITAGVSRSTMRSSRTTELSPKELAPEVARQLMEFVAKIGYSHKKGSSYHNFDHACSVLLAADNMTGQVKSLSGAKVAYRPWVRFAILIAALIRDVDAPCLDYVDNEENGIIFKSRSVTEQDSLDIAWKLLASDNFAALRNVLCTSKVQLNRTSFWQLVVNLVLATDNSNSSISAEREKRWEVAFGGASKGNTALHEAATVVLEQIMMLSYNAHYMQHWQTFAKWNGSLFQEYQEAFQLGALTRDPRPVWHQSVAAYFDNFVLPMIRKIDQAKVLGAAGTEQFKFASENRREWEATGTEEASQGKAAPVHQKIEGAVEATPSPYDTDC